MKRLLNLAGLLLVACLIGCATPVAPSGNALLKGSFDTADAYVQMVTTSLVRERITDAQAAQALDNAKKTRKTLKDAEAALAACKPAVPCTSYIDLLQSVQPNLIAFEAELRKQEGAKK